jgi:hypothetical protein
VIFITDEFLRTRNSFCDVRLRAMLNLAEKAIDFFILEEKLTRFSKDNFDLGVHLTFP